MTVPGVYPRESSIPGRHHQRPRAPPLPSNVVCKFWAQGRCSRRPCPFLHGTNPSQPCNGVSRRPPEESDFRGRRRFPGKNLVWKNPNAAPRPVTATTSPPPTKKTKRDEEKKTLQRRGTDGCISPSKKVKCSNEEKKIKSPDVCDAADTPLDKPNCSLKATASQPPSPANGCISPSKKMKSSNEENKVESPAAYDVADTPLDKPNCGFKATVDGCSSPLKKMKSRDEEKEIESPDISDVVDAPLNNANCNFKTTVDPDLPGKDLAVAETKTNLAVETPLDNATPDAAELTSPSKTEAHPTLSGKFMGILCGGHTRKITGIAVPKVVDKFFTSSDDGKICVWKNLGDGQREQTPEQVIQLRSPISCLIAEGICVFAGAHGGIHVCNVLSKAGLFLPIPAGRVTSLAASYKVLFAGIDNGSIVAWKMIANHDDQGKQKDVQFQPAVCLSGHTSAVTCLAVRGINLFSGDKDGGIRAWNVTSLEAAQELDVPPATHEGAVTSLVFWTDYLLSASLDGKIKVWGGEYTDVNNTLVGLRQIYIHHEQRGILFLGVTDDGAKGPILLCSLLDSTVQLYHLPTFLETGAIQCPRQAVAVHSVLSGVFIGEASGEVSCWSFSTGE